MAHLMEEVARARKQKLKADKKKQLQVRGCFFIYFFLLLLFLLFFLFFLLILFIIFFFQADSSFVSLSCFCPYFY